MRYLALWLFLFSSTAIAQPLRFSGSGIANSSSRGVITPTGIRYDVGGSITFEGEYAPDITLALENPNWEFDISTDGQSMTIHNMTVSFNDTLVINPLVTIDVSLEATIEDLTVDINPSSTTIWTVQEHSFTSMSVSGVYYGIGLTQPFSGNLPNNTELTNYEEGLLDFVNWPNDLTFRSAIETFSGNVREVRRFSSPSSSGWIGVEPYLHIREVRVWEPLSVLLSPVVDSADFNGDNTINGADYLAFARGFGTANAMHYHGDANWDHAVDDADLTILQSQFGMSAPTAAIAIIPEPAAATLLLLSMALLALPYRH